MAGVSDVARVFTAVAEAARAERRTRILRLLETRFDGLPVPRRREQAAPGFVHRTVARESCPDCFGETPGVFGCEGCHGRGWVEHRRQRDPYEVAKTQRYGLTGHAGDRARALDAEIARLEAQTRPPYATPEDELADANQHPPAWWRERERMYRRFDYRPLDVALEQLRHAHPDVAPGSERGLRLLEPLMPEPIRAPEPERMPPTPKGRALSDVSRKQRDEHVRRLLRDTAPAIVAQQTGLSLATVYAIRRSMEDAA